MKKLVLIIMLFFCASTFGQSPKDVDITEFIKEMQQLKKDNNRLQLVWWVPDAYWDIIVSQTNTIAPEIAQQIKEILKDYVLICVGDMVVNGTAGFIYKTENEIRADLVLKDTANNRYFPLPDTEISDDALRIRNVLMPFFAKTMGQLGEGLGMYFFRVQDKNKKSIINPYKRISFSVLQGGKTFTWNAPLPSLLPPRFCPVDNEPMKGNWQYCPIHGAKLKS